MGRPRSEKCDSCRKRHIRCDLVRPVCGQCRRESYVCEREESYTFRHHYFPHQRAPNARDGVADRKKSLALLPLIPSAPLQTDAEEVWYAHLHLVLPNPSETTGQRRTEWIGFEAASNVPGGIAHRSLQALACSVFGRSNQDTALQRHGSERYVRCLHNVNKQLADSAMQRSPDVILAVAILGFYESLFLTTHGAWIRHFLGLGRMLDLAGPGACAHRVIFNTMIAHRFMIILAAMATRRATFLGQAVWKRVPWEVQDQPKDSMDTLLDIISDIPGLLDSDCPSRYANLVDVHRILERWDADESPSLYAHFVQLPSDDPTYPSTWPAPLTSLSLSAVNRHCIHKAALILTIEQVLKSASPCDLSSEGACVLLDQQHKAAVDICRTLDYQLHGEAGTLAGLFILWPLRMAYKVLVNGTPEEVTWLEARIRRSMSIRSDWAIQREAFDTVSYA